jgi:predicted Zn finger-like uncharacterized protein
MMMQCPRCSTRWRVAAAAPIENPLFKCGRCHHLFRQFPGAAPVRDPAPPPTRRSASQPPVDADTLEFIFPERQPAELLLTDDGTVVDETPLAAERAPHPHETAAVVAAEPTTSALPAMPLIIRSSLEATAVIDPLCEDERADEVEDDVGRERGVDGRTLVNERLGDPLDGDEPALADFEDDDDFDAEPLAEADTGRRVRVEETMRAPAGFATIMRAIGTAVAAFAALALMVRVAPDRANLLLSHLPLAGATFAHDRNLASSSSRARRATTPP